MERTQKFHSHRAGSGIFIMSASESAAGSLQYVFAAVPARGTVISDSIHRSISEITGVLIDDRKDNSTL